GAFEAVHRVHHVLQGRVQEPLGSFRVEIADQFRGAFEVGKQHRDLLAFAFERAAGGEDFLRQIRRGIGGGGRRGGGARGGGAGGGKAATPPVQTKTVPRSSLARHWPSMSSSFRSSSAASSSWNCRWRVR